VLALLQSGEFDLLHFVGHGTASTNEIVDAQLLLEGSVDTHENYCREPLRVSVVARYLRCDHSDGGPLVFLNACQAGRLGHQLTSLGGFATAFLDNGAGAFVSSLWSVGDRLAATFAAAFYTSLKKGDAMSQAVAHGREAARRSGDATWLAYVVYAHPAARLTVEPPVPNS
jgi:CHAT domain-containing protein